MEYIKQKISTISSRSISPELSLSYIRNAHLIIETITVMMITMSLNDDHDPIYLSFSAGSPQLLISVAIMNSLIIMIMKIINVMVVVKVMMVVVIKVMVMVVVNLEVDGSVSVLVKDPEQLVQVLLSSCSLTEWSFYN